MAVGIRPGSFRLARSSPDAKNIAEWGIRTAEANPFRRSAVCDRGGSAMPCGFVFPAASVNEAAADWLPEVRLAAARGQGAHRTGSNQVNLSGH
jgi:hypothetical protein